MVKASLIAGALVLCAPALGCTTATPPADRTTARRPRLINGGPADAEIDGVLRVMGDVECTGFLITNQWAITARHCISSVLAAQPQQIVVAFGGTRTAPAQTTSVAEVQRSPPGPDLALLLLSSPLVVQGKRYGFQQRAFPNYAASAQGDDMVCAGWGSTGAANPAADRPTIASLPLDSVTGALLGVGPSSTGQQIAAGDAGGSCSFPDLNLTLPAGVIAGLYTDGEGVAIDLTQPAIRSWIESTLVAHDPNIPANAASIPVPATLDGQQIDLFWTDDAGQMNGIRLSGFPLSPDPSPTAIGALSDDLFTNARPAAAYSNGTLHILGKTVSGRVVDGVAGGVGPVSTWTPVAVMPLITGGLGVANRDTDRIDLLARSASGPVVHAWFSQGSWVSSELIGGSFDEDVLGVWDMGALQLYGVALGYVFHKSGFEGDWQSQDISGNITSACAAVAPGDGTMDLLARLPNGHLGHKTYVNGWVDGFPDLGLPIPGEPSAIAAAGAIHVFARNPDGSIWHAHFPREPGAGMGPPAPSTTFHRLLHDDPPGGCNTRDYSGEGDWYPNYCKTECAAPAIGISSSFAGRGSCAMAGAEIPSLDPPSAQSDDPDETFEEFTHLLACNNNHSPGIVVGSGYTLHFETSDDQPSPNVGYDWASGLRKGECDNSSAIVGVASDQYWHGDGTCFLAYGIVGALCSTLMSPPGTVAAASNCQVVDFTNDSANEAGGGTSWVGADWDYKFHKGQCGDGRYIKGIAHPQLGAGSARATKILCCSAQYVPSP